MMKLHANAGVKKKKKKKESSFNSTAAHSSEELLVKKIENMTYCNTSDFSENISA